MRPVIAWLAMASLALATVALLIAPWQILAPALALGLLLARRRTPLAWFGIGTVIINGAIMGLVTGSTGTTLGPFSAAGLEAGAIGGLRVASIVACNLGGLQRLGPAQWIEGLRLPRGPTAWIGAITLATVDIGRDAVRIRDARRMIGTWPKARLARVRASVGLLPAIMERGVAAARRRREALQLAGVETGEHFVPIVAVAALAMAGRLALVALPNISLAYVVIFTGGVIFGARIGAVAGLVSMVGTNLVLTGLTPTAFANVPAMALVGALGGWLASVDYGTDNGRAVGALAGVVATIGFSMVADVGEWAMVSEFRGNYNFLAARIAAGLLFNTIPAITNGIVFWLAVGPIQRAFKQAPAMHPL